MGRDSAHSIVYARLEVMKLPTRIHLSRHRTISLLWSTISPGITQHYEHWIEAMFRT